MFRFSVILLILWAIYSGLSAAQITFYSQSDKIARENLLFLTTEHGQTRQVIELNGNYDLISGDNQQFLGRVSIPSMYLENHALRFRKTFSIPQYQNQPVRLHCERIIGSVEISLNTELIFSGSQNFLPIDLPVADGLLTSSENSLEFKIEPWPCQNHSWPMWMPINLPRIDNGIAGVVYLEILPELRIRDISVQPLFEGDSVLVTGRLTITGRDSIRNQDLAALRLLKNGEVIQRVDLRLEAGVPEKEYVFPFRMKTIPAAFWHPDDPILYSLEISLLRKNEIVDRHKSGLALRKVSMADQKFRLNDAVYELKGMNYIYQDPNGAGLINKHVFLKDLVRIKELGFNAVRVAYLPLPDIFFHLADSLGIVCLQDLPFSLLTPARLSDSLTFNQWRAYVKYYQKMTTEHPSFVAIGAGFISQTQEEKTRYDISLHQHQNSGLLFFNTYNPGYLREDNSRLYSLEILERNDQVRFLNRLLSELPGESSFLVSGLSQAISYRMDSQILAHNLDQIIELYHWMNQNPWKKMAAGQFVLTYHDYYLETPALQAGPENKFRLSTIGVMDINRNPKSEIIEGIKTKSLYANMKNHADTDPEFGTSVFIIIGLINFFIFLIIYRSFIEFRKNIFRAIRKPHGFFVDLQERRLISYEQSFFLMTILAINAAIMLGGIFYFFRNNLYLDYLLSLVMPVSSVKFWIAYLIWRPVLFVPALAMLILFFFIILALPIKILSFFRKARIRIRQAIAISAWSAAPFLILLPFGMFFYNLLGVMKSYWILLIVLLFFHFWYYIRWLNGTRVMALLTYPRVFMYSVFWLAITIGGFSYYINQKIAIIEHLKFVFRLYYFHS